MQMGGDLGEVGITFFLSLNSYSGCGFYYFFKFVHLFISVLFQIMIKSEDVREIDIFKKHSSIVYFNASKRYHIL